MAWYSSRSERKPREGPLCSPGHMPKAPIYRRDVERAWEDWLQLPEGPRSVPPGELPELYSPLPPGWWFTKQGMPARICLSIGQGPGTCQYRLQLLMLNSEKVWVVGEHRPPHWRGYNPQHPFASLRSVGAYRTIKGLGEKLSQEKMLPFDPMLRHAMPDRPPDDAWIGATVGTTGWYLKVYRKWNDRKRPFVEPLIDRVHSRDLYRLAVQASEIYGLPIRIPNIPTGTSILFGRQPMPRSVAPVTLHARWRVD